VKLVISSLLFASFLASASPALAQNPPAQPPLQKPPEKAPEKPALIPTDAERLTAWPKVDSKTLDTMHTDIERLRKAHTPEMGDQAHAALVAVGAAVVPELLPILGKERDDQARIRVEDVLDEITTAVHTRLLAPEFANKSREIRTWVLRRCGQFPDTALRAQAEAALQKALDAVPRADDKDEQAAVNDERYAASLCVTSTGSVKALPSMQKYVLDAWGKRGPELRAALNAVRCKEATDYALKLVADKDRKIVVAGLNMLAGCGTKDAIPAVKPQLDNTDNSIRIAAINALRGIVDGELPIANLPVFEAIELAKKWKTRC
jgi:hypothetical protein